MGWCFFNEGVGRLGEMKVFGLWGEYGGKGES